MATATTATATSATATSATDDHCTGNIDVIVLESSAMGNGASGWAMGWVGRGYQVPRESISWGG